MGLQQCKKQLNGEHVHELPQEALLKVNTVAVHAAQDNEDDEEDSEADAEEDPGNIAKVEVCTHSTNAADDYAHRGTKLKTMPFYVYRMYVCRVRKPKGLLAEHPNIFFFENH